MPASSYQTVNSAVMLSLDESLSLYQLSYDAIWRRWASIPRPTDPDNHRTPARAEIIAPTDMKPGLGVRFLKENPSHPAQWKRDMRGFVAARQLQSLDFLKFVLQRGRMIATAQIRAARGLLKWTQAMLAHRAAVSAVTLNMIENETVRPREATLMAIRRALEAGGVQFLEEDGAGVGVRFNSPARDRQHPNPSGEA